jgi:hypothetical protein
MCQAESSIAVITKLRAGGWYDDTDDGEDENGDEGDGEDKDEDNDHDNGLSADDPLVEFDLNDEP